MRIANLLDLAPLPIKVRTPATSLFLPSGPPSYRNNPSFVSNFSPNRRYDRRHLRRVLFISAFRSSLSLRPRHRIFSSCPSAKPSVILPPMQSMSQPATRTGDTKQPSGPNPSANPPAAQPPMQTMSQPATSTDKAKQPLRSIYRRVLPSTLTELNSPEGKSRFKSALESGNAESFFPLVSQFQTQSHPALCGLTTLTTVLNALEIDPKRVWAHPWRWFAESLLDCCLDMENVKISGITMDELAKTASCQGTAVRSMRGLSLDETRDLIRESVRERPDGSFEFLVASYDRATLGQTGSGHFSPIAAFDEATDSVLVLDVARFKYGPHWIPVQILLEATRKTDSSCGRTRGFLTFRKRDESQEETDPAISCQEQNCQVLPTCKSSTSA